jgi:hypothetical protein
LASLRAKYIKYSQKRTISTQQPCLENRGWTVLILLKALTSSSIPVMSIVKKRTTGTPTGVRPTRLCKEKLQEATTHCPSPVLPIIEET